MDEVKTTPVLFLEKKDCCACGACVNSCPRDAVSMKEDEYGFLYPYIDADKCVKCGKCKTVCAYQNYKETNTPLKTWAAVSSSERIVMHSASGGVFSTLAAAFLKSKDYVSGAVFDDGFNLHHIITDNMKDLIKLQGSKYTQSNTGDIFRQIKEKLKTGKNVLFCGCPCQVAGLKAYLGKEYGNLFTLDLICHGVPSNRMFKDYLKCYENKKEIKTKKFLFRDKNIGWGKNGSLISYSGKKYRLFESSVSYFYYFAQSLIMRTNCYSCKYANGKRCGDISIGDYWGIQKEHPECLGGSKIDESKGVSVIIANTDKGLRLINEHRGLFNLYESTFEKAAKGNAQLNVPTKYDHKREEILALYADGGWENVEVKFNNEIGLRRYSGYIKSLIPQKLKRTLKRHLKQR